MIRGNDGITFKGNTIEETYTVSGKFSWSGGQKVYAAVQRDNSTSQGTDTRIHLIFANNSSFAPKFDLPNPGS